MEDWQQHLIGFGIINLCLFVFRSPLSLLVLGLFAVGRPNQAGIEFKKAAPRFFYMDPEGYKPSRDEAIKFLAWTGVINFFGCIAFYLLIASGIFDENISIEDDATLPVTRFESK